MLITSFIYFLLMAGVACLLVSEVKSRWLRIGILPMFLVCFGFGTFISWNVIGHAKPSVFAFDLPQKVQLQSYHFAYNSRIYLWVLIQDEPYAIALDWDLSCAQALVDASAKAEQEHRTVILVFPKTAIGTTNARSCGANRSSDAGGDGSVSGDNVLALGTISVLTESPDTMPPKDQN